MCLTSELLKSIKLRKRTEKSDEAGHEILFRIELKRTIRNKSDVRIHKNIVHSGVVPAIKRRREENKKKWKGEKTRAQATIKYFQPLVSN